MNGTHGRTRTRRVAVQALYQWQLTGLSVADIQRQFEEDRDLSGVDVAYFLELLQETTARIDELDDHLTPVLDRPLEAVDPVERAILRVGTYELCHRPDVPYRVVINEAIGLAKTFGAEDGHKYVNSVLDRIARKVRAPELERRRRR